MKKTKRSLALARNSKEKPFMVPSQWRYVWLWRNDFQFAICNQAQEAFILQNTCVILRNIFYNMILLLHYLRNKVAIFEIRNIDSTVIDLQPSELVSFSLKTYSRKRLPWFMKKATLIHENAFVQTFHFSFDAIIFACLHILAIFI